MLTTECGLLKKHETDIRGGIFQNVSQWWHWQTMTGWKQGLFDFVAFVVVGGGENMPTCYFNFCRPIMNAVRYCIVQCYLIGLVDLDWHSKGIPKNCLSKKDQKLLII
jgi:hypothetical protein